MLDSLSNDIRIAVRTFLRTPAFTLAAVCTLALGIGANTAIFSLINAALLQPLPYPNPDRIVQLWMTNRDGGGGVTLAIPEFNLFKQQTGALRDVAAYDFGGPGINLTGSAEPEQVKGIHVSENYFRLFGANPLHGRTFTRDEDLPNGGRVVVLSHSLWQRRFNSDASLVGKTISLGHESYQVVGVLGPQFHADPPAQLWLPLQSEPNSTSQAHYIRVAARLREGVSMQQANAVLKLATAEYLRAYPLMNQQIVFAAKPIRETSAGNVRTALMVLFGTVTLVLLIACSNVANLLLARGIARQREMSLRAALGAGKARLLTQLLTESMLLSVAGGLLGFAVGRFSLAALLALNPEVIQGSVSLDWRVLTFTAAIAIATAFLFGLIPALQGSSIDLSTAMKESGSRGGTGRTAVRTKSILVVVQVALAVVLVIGAGLMLRTFAALRNVNPGIDPHRILTMDMSLTGTRFRDTAAVSRMVEDATRRIQSIPGVSHVAASWTLPIELAFGSSIVIEGRPLTDSVVHGGALMRPISSQFFQVFRIPILRGRAFTDRDAAATNSVAIISDSMARKYWPNSNPIGERITLDKFIGPDFAAPPREIVGIAADVRDTGIAKETSPLVYIPQGQVPNGMTRIDSAILPLSWSIRTEADPYLFSAAIQKELRIASGGIPVAHIRSMDEVVKESTLHSDFNAVLLISFAVSALVLAAIGIYGLMIYTIQQRIREIGIRLALGASPQLITRTILSQSLKLTLAGVLLGSVASLGLARFMQTLVFGVKPSDPFVIVGACLTLGITAAAASFFPARRASILDPASVLRAE